MAPAKPPPPPTFLPPILQAALRAEHHRLRGLSPFAASRLVVERVRGLPEHGAHFYVAHMSRSLVGGSGGSDDAERARGSGSRSAAEAPPWAAHAASAAAPLPVLVAVSWRGLLTRPLPPAYARDADGLPLPPPRYESALEEPTRHLFPPPRGPSPSELLSADGAPVPWHVHAMAAIETWGSVHQPGGAQALTYTVRERSGLVAVALHSAQAREMAASLHAWVFAQLAQREGRRRSHARSDASDFGSGATALALALCEARAAARAALPDADDLEWSVLQDAVSGDTAHWHPGARRTIFSRRC